MIKRDTPSFIIDIKTTYCHTYGVFCILGNSGLHAIVYHWIIHETFQLTISTNIEVQDSPKYLIWFHKISLKLWSSVLCSEWNWQVLIKSDLANKSEYARTQWLKRKVHLYQSTSNHGTISMSDDMSHREVSPGVEAMPQDCIWNCPIACIWSLTSVLASMVPRACEMPEWYDDLNTNLLASIFYEKLR